MANASYGVLQPLNLCWRLILLGLARVFGQTLRRHMFLSPLARALQLKIMTSSWMRNENLRMKSGQQSCKKLMPSSIPRCVWAQITKSASFQRKSFRLTWFSSTGCGVLKMPRCTE